MLLKSRSKSANSCREQYWNLQKVERSINAPVQPADSLCVDAGCKPGSSGCICRAILSRTDRRLVLNAFAGTSWWQELGPYSIPHHSSNSLVWSLSGGSLSFINMKRKIKESKHPAVGKGHWLMSRWPATANGPPRKEKQARTQPC